MNVQLSAVLGFAIGLSLSFAPRAQAEGQPQWDAPRFGPLTSLGVATLKAAPTPDDPAIASWPVRFAETAVLSQDVAYTGFRLRAGAPVYRLRNGRSQGAAAGELASWCGLGEMHPLPFVTKPVDLCVVDMADGRATLGYAFAGTVVAGPLGTSWGAGAGSVRGPARPTWFATNVALVSPISRVDRPTVAPASPSDFPPMEVQVRLLKISDTTVNLGFYLVNLKDRSLPAIFLDGQSGVLQAGHAYFALQGAIFTITPAADRKSAVTTSTLIAKFTPNPPPSKSTGAASRP